jgi:hypothetical protein
MYYALMLQGYTGVAKNATDFYTDDGRAPTAAVLECPEERNTSVWGPQLITIVTVAGFVVLATLAVLLINAFRPKGYRSATKRAWDHVKWRLQGMPKSGTISVVVTDIEGYSGGCHRLVFAATTASKLDAVPRHAVRLKCVVALAPSAAEQSRWLMLTC